MTGLGAAAVAFTCLLVVAVVVTLLAAGIALATLRRLEVDYDRPAEAIVADCQRYDRARRVASFAGAFALSAVLALVVLTIYALVVALA